MKAERGRATGFPRTMAALLGAAALLAGACGDGSGNAARDAGHHARDAATDAPPSAEDAGADAASVSAQFECVDTLARSACDRVLQVRYFASEDGAVHVALGTESDPCPLLDNYTLYDAVLFAASGPFGTECTTEGKALTYNTSQHNWNDSVDVSTDAHAYRLAFEVDFLDSGDTTITLTVDDGDPWTLFPAPGGWSDPNGHACPYDGCP